MFKDKFERLSRACKRMTSSLQNSCGAEVCLDVYFRHNMGGQSGHF